MRNLRPTSLQKKRYAKWATTKLPERTDQNTVCRCQLIPLNILASARHPSTMSFSPSSSFWKLKNLLRGGELVVKMKQKRESKYSSETYNFNSILMKKCCTLFHVSQCRRVRLAFLALIALLQYYIIFIVTSFGITVTIVSFTKTSAQRNTNKKTCQMSHNEKCTKEKTKKLYVVASSCLSISSPPLRHPSTMSFSSSSSFWKLKNWLRGGELWERWNKNMNKNTMKLTLSIRFWWKKCWSLIKQILLSRAVFSNLVGSKVFPEQIFCLFPISETACDTLTYTYTCLCLRCRPRETHGRFAVRPHN